MEISRHLLTENHTDKKDTEKMHNEFTEENPADIDFTQTRRKKQTAAILFTAAVCPEFPPCGDTASAFLLFF